jgi:hypothetical protein
MRVRRSPVGDITTRRYTHLSSPALAHWRTPGPFLGVCPRSPHRTNVRYTKIPRRTDLLSPSSLSRYNRIMLRKCRSKWLLSDGRLQPCAPHALAPLHLSDNKSAGFPSFAWGLNSVWPLIGLLRAFSHERARSSMRICVCTCVRVLDKSKNK